MFICIECHTDMYGDREHFSGSHGPCECCGNTRSCYDCHCPAPKKEKEKTGMKIGNTEIEVVKGSVIDVDANVLVNAANVKMRGGGGVDGAVHKAAGIGMLIELEAKAPRGGTTGIPVLTHGHNLKQAFVLHVAGPIWNDGNSGEPFALMLCYLNCLQIANEMNVKTIAFPGISTGIYGYPLEKAAERGVASIAAFLNANPDTSLELVTIAMYREEEFDVFTAALDKLAANP